MMDNINTIQNLPFSQSMCMKNSDMFLDVNALNNSVQYNVNNSDREFDRTIFANIDPDMNLLNSSETVYYNEDTFNAKCQKMNFLSLIHINICSIPKNFKRFELFLENLKHEFHIICCSESWFKESSKDRHTPKGYNHVYDFRPKKRGGGTSIFIKNNLQYVERGDLKLDINVDCVNSCFIEIDKKCIDVPRNIIVGCIYRAPHCSLPQFNEQLNDALNGITKENKDIYILGDINIDLGS